MSEQQVKWTDERIESVVSSRVVYSKHEGACVHTHTVRMLMRQIRDDYQAALDAANARISEQDKRIAELEGQRINSIEMAGAIVYDALIDESEGDDD